MFAPWLPGVRPGDDQTFELDAATEELRQFIELQGIEKVRIVGHGLGGLVATRLAARYPEVITGVVLSDPSSAPRRWRSGCRRRCCGWHRCGHSPTRPI